MNDIESLEDFYNRKFNWVPDNMRKEIGHFNLFKLEPYVEGQPTSIPYRRRDFYKIMLVKGNTWTASAQVFTVFSLPSSSISLAISRIMRYSSPMVPIFLN